MTYSYNFGDMLGDMLEDSARRLGIQLEGDMAVVRLYAAKRIQHLSTIVGQPGYLEAVRAEADNVLLEAAVNAVAAADAADRELFGLVSGFLGAGARALAGSPM